LIGVVAVMRLLGVQLVQEEMVQVHLMVVAVEGDNLDYFQMMVQQELEQRKRVLLLHREKQLMAVAGEEYEMF
jgi:hypothetical protein